MAYPYPQFNPSQRSPINSIINRGMFTIQQHSRLVLEDMLDADTRNGGEAPFPGPLSAAQRKAMEQVAALRQKALLDMREATDRVDAMAVYEAACDEIVAAAAVKGAPTVSTPSGEGWTKTGAILNIASQRIKQLPERRFRPWELRIVVEAARDIELVNPPSWAQRAIDSGGVTLSYNDTVTRGGTTRFMMIARNNHGALLLPIALTITEVVRPAPPVTED